MPAPAGTHVPVLACLRTALPLPWQGSRLPLGGVGVQPDGRADDIPGGGGGRSQAAVLHRSAAATALLISGRALSSLPEASRLKYPRLPLCPSLISSQLRSGAVPGWGQHGREALPGLSAVCRRPGARGAHQGLALGWSHRYICYMVRRATLRHLLNDEVRPTCSAIPYPSCCHSHCSSSSNRRRAPPPGPSASPSPTWPPAPGALW